MAQPTQTVKLTPDSKKEIVDAIRDLRKTIVTEERRSQTFSENVADSLTSGKGLLSSLRDAIKTESAKESEKMKKNLDPLEIMKRMTGGSRLATTLAGKAIGRSNDDIRKSIGFSRTEKPEPTLVSDQADTARVANPVASSEAIPLLDQIAQSVGLMALRVTDIANKLKATKSSMLDQNGRLRDKHTGQFMSGADARSLSAQGELLKSIRDALVGIRSDSGKQADKQEDQARQEKAKVRSTPSSVPQQVSPSGNPFVSAKAAAPEESSWFGNLMGSFTGLEKTAASFGVALGALLTPVESLKTAFSSTMEGLKGVVKSFSFFSSPSAVTNTLKTGGELIQSGGNAIKDVVKVASESDLASKTISTAARIGQKLTAKPATTVASHAGTEAAATTAKTVAKSATTAEQAATKVAKPGIMKASKEKIGKILAKRLPSAFGGSTLGKMIPGVGAALGLGFAVSRLVKGDVVGAALEAVSGLGGAVTAVPAMVGQLVRDTYKDVYDKYPEEEPELMGERLPELAEIVKSKASEWLSGKGSTATSETGSPNLTVASSSSSGSSLTPAIAPSPSTGSKLIKSTAQRQQLNESPSGANISAPSININNVNNAKTSTALTPHIPSPRSTDSSYLRSLDHNYAS